MEKFDVVIVGAGPSGVMAGIKAGERGKRVCIIEKNEQICKKLFLTGHGRCNLTNLADLNTFLLKYRNGDFLRNSFSQFFNTDLIEFFEENGLKLKLERGNRVFPETDRASDVVSILDKLLKKNKVELLFKSSVKDILKTEKYFEVVISKGKIFSEKVVLACGGKSFPQTGSTGDGYRFAKKFGHTIISPKPALCGVVIKENFVKKWQGVKLKNVLIKVVTKDKKIEEEFGEVLFTHYGISGPVILNLSGDISEQIKKMELFLIINFKPFLTVEQLDNRLQREFKENSNKDLKNIFKDLLPNRLIEEFLRYSGINGEKKGNQVMKEEREKIVKNLQNFRLTILDVSGFKDSMVTRGGVDVKEINPKTMESKIMPGLFLAGEIIDVDGKTGGYNLQFAFTTGYVAGVHL